MLDSGTYYQRREKRKDRKTTYTRAEETQRSSYYVYRASVPVAADCHLASGNWFMTTFMLYIVWSWRCIMHARTHTWLRLPSPTHAKIDSYHANHIVSTDDSPLSTWKKKEHCTVLYVNEKRSLREHSIYSWWFQQRGSFIYLLLNPFQIVGRFGFSRYIVFPMYLDMAYI